MRYNPSFIQCMDTDYGIGQTYNFRHFLKLVVFVWFPVVKNQSNVKEIRVLAKVDLRNQRNFVDNRIGDVVDLKKLYIENVFFETSHSMNFTCR